jgi:Flp pilus assembly protein TadD
MDKLTVQYSTYGKALPPQPIRVTVGGWAGAPQKMVDGSEPQPWHCLPFVEASTNGLELVYPYDVECHVVNENGAVRFDWDFAREPGGSLTGGEFVTFSPKDAPKYYLFNTGVDVVPPPGHVVRTEPHPRFFTDDTGTAPIALPGQVQNEWWPRKLFVVFRAPRAGERHIFRKAEPYVQLLFVPERAGYTVTKLSPEEEGRRREREAAIDLARREIAGNIWHNPAGSTFGDHYKVLARAFDREGQGGVSDVIREASDRQRLAIPSDKPIPECLGVGAQYLRRHQYDQAKAVYHHVLSRDPNNAEALSRLGICVACSGQPAVGLKMMSEAVALQPRTATYQTNLGEMLRLLGRFEEAEDAFRTSLELEPREPQVLSALGLTLAQQGRWAEALEACQAAVRLNPRAAMCHLRLGDVLAHQGKTAEARAAYQAALALDPAFDDAKRALQALAPPA